MNTINAKYLRKNLKKVAQSVKDSGSEYTVLYRSMPAFKIVPIKRNKHTTNWNSWLKEHVGISTATDITTPDKDKEILRKRLIEKHTKNIPGY